LQAISRFVESQDRWIHYHVQMPPFMPVDPSQGAYLDLHR
jgi:hypothetical protein